MPYNKQTWVDLPTQSTPLSAERLNYIEEGIRNAMATAEAGGSASAEAVSFDPAGSISATNVQAAIAEVVSDFNTQLDNLVITSAYDDLTDVDVSAKSDGTVSSWDNGSGKYVARPELKVVNGSVSVESNFGAVGYDSNENTVGSLSVSGSQIEAYNTDYDSGDSAHVQLTPALAVMGITSPLPEYLLIDQNGVAVTSTAGVFTFNGDEVLTTTSTAADLPYVDPDDLGVANVQEGIDYAIAHLNQAPASNVSYANGGSGLTSQDVQGALDEVVGRVNAKAAKFVFDDTVKTTNFNMTSGTVYKVSLSSGNVEGTLPDATEGEECYVIISEGGGSNIFTIHYLSNQWTSGEAIHFICDSHDQWYVASTHVVQPDLDLYVLKSGDVMSGTLVVGDVDGTASTIYEGAATFEAGGKIVIVDPSDAIVLNGGIQSIRLYENSLVLEDSDTNMTLTKTSAGELKVNNVTLTELTQDIVGAMAVEGSNIDLTYNDAAGTLTIAVTGLSSSSLSDFTEAVQDVIGGLAAGGSGLTATYNDVSNTWVVDVNVDGSTIEVSGDALRVKDGGITSAKISDATIVDGDISGSAAIALSKLATNPLARANHTGTQTMSTISDAGALATLSAVGSAQITDNSILDADINSAAAIALSKLATDPLARANHTGTQAASTISDFTEATQDVVGALGLGGSGLTYTYNDGSNTAVLDVNVDGSTLEVNADTVRVKDSGITSAKIADGTIVDGDVNASAAIAGSKITPTFTADVSAPGAAITDVDGTGVVTLSDQTTAPSAPASDKASVFAQKFGGRDLPMVRASTGVSRNMLNLPFDKIFRLMRPGSSSTINVLGYGGAVNSVGTITTSVGSATLPPRSNIVTAASVSSDATVAHVDNFFRGASTDLYAGFYYYACLNFPDASYNNTGASTGTRIFVGLSSNNPITNDLGKSQHCAMFNRGHVNGSETHTNWQFITNNNSATGNVIDTSMAFAVSKVYEFRIWCPAGATTIYWQIDNLTDATVQSGSTGTQLPGATTGIAQIAQLRTVDAVARNMQMICTYIETDRG